MSTEISPPRPEPGKTSAAVNRRASVRYPRGANTYAQVFPANTIEAQHALIANLSAQGIGLLLSHPIAAGTPVRVQLLCDSPPTSLELDASVAHATPFEDGIWLIGCAFARRLSAEELRALLA
jgi:hypothetical protein